MTYIVKPKFHHPSLPKNALGYTHRDYEGSVSTLCAGCGHDSISAAIIEACYELAIEPHRVAKLSGIGCSSKTPTYFLGQSHGFNSVHGRMPSVLTGANLANRDLIYLGVSGDGDSASIGLGQFAHIIAGSVDAFYLVNLGKLTWLACIGSFIIPTLIGNILGGVSLVAVLNYAQVASETVGDG